MKFLHYLILSILIPGVFADLHAQMVPLTEVVHFPLINTLEDSLDHVDDLIAENAPFSGVDGIYSYGGFSGYNQTSYDTSLIRSLTIPELADTSFGISLEFKLDTLDRQIHPIIVLGLSYRYLSFGTGYDQFKDKDYYYINLNNGSIASIVSGSPDVTMWHQLFIYHSRTRAMTWFYLDGSPVDTVPGTLEDGGFDYNLSNSDFGGAFAYRGLWRHLRVYKADVVSSRFQDNAPSGTFTVSPNPVGVHGMVRIHSNFDGPVSMECFSLNGVKYFERSIRPGTKALEIYDIPKGICILRLGNDQEGYLSRLIVCPY